MLRFSWRLLFLLASSILPVAGQTLVEAPRPDGRTTRLLVYRAKHPAASCSPLAILSHGAGGSEEGYSYLAEALARQGFTAIVMGHRDSGRDALRSDIRGKLGVLRGVAALVSDPEAEQSRLLDAGAALQWADRQCRAPFRVLMGHSMGAITVMLEAGARNRIGVSSPPAGQDRFDAYVALSPEGPGIVFPEHAWSGIRKPMLVLTGTRDHALSGGPEARQIPWRDMPEDAQRKCRWMAVLDGATHMNFAGNGMGARRVEVAVTQTIRSFLTGSQAGRCVTQPPIAGSILKIK